MIKRILFCLIVITLVGDLAHAQTKLKFGAKSETQMDETNCELNIVAATMDGSPRAGEQIIVTSETVTEVFKGYTDETGKLTFVIPQGNSYHISFRTINEKRDYTDLEIPTVDGHLVYDFTMNFDFQKTVFTLKNVYFDTGTAHLKTASSKALDELLDVLVHKTHLALEISGHTDNVGKHDYNMKLSHDRAQAVVDYLIAKGAYSDNLKAEGYGETQPVASNESPEGRQQNRRTELRILHE